MTSTQVLDHHRAVLDEDWSQVEAQAEEFLTQLHGFRTAKDLLETRLRFPKEPYPSVHPRMSLFLIRNVYMDMLDAEAPVSMAAAGVVHRSLLSISGATTELASHPGTVAQANVAACGEAEDFFDQVVRQVRTATWQAQDTVKLYHSSDGQPLALRKSFDAKSALTLAAISIEGVIIPAGTISGLDIGMDKNKTGTYTNEKQGYSLSTYRVEEALAIHPRRLSAWAYEDPLDRALFAVISKADGSRSYDEARGKMLQERSLDDFKETAAQIMKLCGVAT